MSSFKGEVFFYWLKGFIGKFHIAIFQLCNVEAPTLIKNGVLIDLEQATHSARLEVEFLDRAILEVLGALGVRYVKDSI